VSLGGGKLEAFRASRKTFSELSIEERDALVLELLAQAEGGLKPGDLCAKVCGDVAGDPRIFGTLGSTLKRLRKAGKVETGSGRRWSVTEAGKPVHAEPQGDETGVDA
jgi:hypothetical protein